MVATMATGTSAAHQSSVHQINAASAAPMPTVRKLSRRFTRGGEFSAPWLERLAHRLRASVMNGSDT